VTGPARSGWRPGHGAAEPAAAGVRVVMDLRPLQRPDAAPLTAAYLDGLLTALDADPVAGESFAFLLAVDLDDPTGRWTSLEVIGRRLLPPTRILRAGALTVDPFLLRGASVGAAWRSERGGSAGAVYHAAAGALPIASGIPVVAALLDLAPWLLPDDWQRGRAARFGQRVRARLLRDAAAVVVPSRSAAVDARRVLHVKPGALRTVLLAPRPAFRPEAAAGARHERERLGLGERYAVLAGRFDARQDLPTLLEALGALAADPVPPGLAAPDTWPPRVCLVGASPDDRASISRAATKAGVAEAIVYAPALDDDRLAALVAGSRFVVHPVRSDATGTVAMEALAAGVPVVASAVGALPEIIGPAGILVEPGDARRLAIAIRAAWSDDDLHATLTAAAGERVAAARTWADVARETRAIWAEAAGPSPMI
jgi:glycosyltransferase involved in cell wall biosynthesis